MKIVHITTCLEGGAANATISLHRALIRSGVDSKILYLRKGANEVEFAYAYFKTLSIYKRCKEWSLNFSRRLLNYFSVFFSDRPDEVFSFPKTGLSVITHPLVKNADVIHLHWVANFIDPEYFFRNCNKNVVWTFHDLWPISGGFHYKPYKLPIHYEKLENKFIQSKLNALSYSNLKIVCPSQWLNTKVRNLDLHNLQTIVIRNSPDSAFFQSLPELNVNNKTTKRIGFIADSVGYTRKGFSCLIESFEILNTVSNVPIELAVVGKAKNIPHNKKLEVRYFNRIINKTELIKFYQSCDLIVCPSLQDISSNVIMEALCCGIPVVGFENTGLAELIKGDYGSVCKPNAIALSQAIDKELMLNRKGNSLMVNAQSEFNIEKMVENYLSIYKKFNQ